MAFIRFVMPQRSGALLFVRKSSHSPWEADPLGFATEEQPEALGVQVPLDSLTINPYDVYSSWA